MRHVKASTCVSRGWWPGVSVELLGRRITEWKSDEPILARGRGGVGVCGALPDADVQVFVLHFPGVIQRVAGRGAFGRFKRVLAVNNEERVRWGAFKAARVQERLAAWLADERMMPAAGAPSRET